MLVKIFPGFLEAHTAAEVSEEESLPSPSLHSVMIPFTQYFGSVSASSSERQLETLAAFINRGVEGDTVLKNAISTCFLEHLRQIRAYQALSPYLSPEAKRRTHA